MTLYDLTLTISEDLPVYPGDPPIRLSRLSSIDQGEEANLTYLSSTVHIGTHVDAPDHFLGDGRTVDKIPIDLMVGESLLIELPSKGSITRADLQEASIPSGTRRLLLKTSNSRWWEEGLLDFREDFIALEQDAAELLVALGIELVGVDYLSVAPYHDPGPTHRTLLEAGILIIEGLDLSRVLPGSYRLYCLPLKIRGADGAPARVLLEDGRGGGGI
jgi:arylformamidase